MAPSSRQTFSAPAEELTNAILYVENHQWEGKPLKKLDEDRKCHALGNDPMNATLFQEEYDKSGDAGCNNVVENIQTYFSQSNVVQTVAMKMGLQLKVQHAMVFSVSSCEEQSLQ